MTEVEIIEAPITHLAVWDVMRLPKYEFIDLKKKNPKSPGGVEVGSFENDFIISTHAHWSDIFCFPKSCRYRGC